MYNEAYNLPGKQRLVALINADNHRSFSVDMFNFGIPSVAFGSRNTRVDFTTHRGLFFGGGRQFFYNRLNLPEFFLEGFNLTEVNILGLCSTTLEIAEAINAQYGTAIIEEDIVLESVLGNYHVLKTKPTSYAWTGTIQVWMQVDTSIALSDILVINVIDGLHFPEV